MKTMTRDVDALCERLHLGKDHELQERAVAAALRSLLVEGRRGVVLADEVGFGKTYEALAVAALLAEHARQKRSKPFERVLILCKSSLLGKWQEELSPAREKGRGFLQYLTGEYWPKKHPFCRILPPVTISRRASADDKTAIRDNGRLQARPGIYIVNQEVLTEKNRDKRHFLKRLYRTLWDLIIVDEAHHLARWTKPAFIFAPNGDMMNYDQGIQFKRILALTATPFELTPGEMVQLLALVRADKEDRQTIEKGLKLYVEWIERFFSLRQRSESDSLRQKAVNYLRKLRDDDVLGDETKGTGLQSFLRRYLIRNTKQQNERRYFLVNKSDGKYELRQFDKLADLQRILSVSPLLPFDGADTLFYLELRELIQQTCEQARKCTDTRTFITMDLRQGLSSYPQVEYSALLGRDYESARRLKKLVHVWNTGNDRRLHPKVQALVDIVAEIATAEIEKVKLNPATWVSKVLIFNKLIGERDKGTAGHLRKVLHDRIEPIFADFLEEQLEKVKGLGTRDKLARRIREHIKISLDSAKDEMDAGARQPLYCRVPAEFVHEDFERHRGKHLIDAYRNTILRRAEQSLFLTRCILEIKESSDSHVRSWVESQVVNPLKIGLMQIVNNYLSDELDKKRPLEEVLARMEMAERECIVLLEEQQSISIVGRYDGTNSRYREARRRNFNRPFNPFVLLVSQVGEEGIDLQEQCRYVVHYDLEWNPAKMEQREGRVDRVGWGRANESITIDGILQKPFIDVRFMLLKGTYEERIFHAVMQRAQWFQVLIGSKRKELGQIDDDNDKLLSAKGDLDEGPIVDRDDAGRLTDEEKQAVMIDLRP
jgi:SNF2 family DNA or RNA helicase